MSSGGEGGMYEALARLFHEPGRLAIMSVLCAADGGVAFTELKTSCGLTDGNLNRHLKMLQEAGAVRSEKSFVDLKPRTTLFLTAAGIESFHEYLAALEKVLEHAKASLPPTKAAAAAVSAGTPPLHRRAAHA